MSDLIARINECNDKADYQTAVDLVERALIDAPDDYALHIAAGNARYGLKQYDKAEQAYLKAAALCPEDVVALSNLAGVYFETARYEDGLKICEQALARDSTYLNALIHCGNMLSSLNRYGEALTQYEKALQNAPNDTLVLYNTAYALCMTGKKEQAGQIYKRLLTISPDDAEYLFAYAAFLEDGEQYEQAAETYLRLLAIDDTPTTHIMLGGCLYNLTLTGQNDAVWRLTDKWLNAFPDNPIALHSFDTLKESHEVKRASAEYVQELFDAFADSFDSVLSGLAYHAPSLVADAVATLDFKTTPAVLDLGCGTGLCGAALKEKGVAVSALTGVDLSPAMLEKACKRQLYTTLHQSDILSYLPEKAGCFDLIMSSDVFTYLGDLSALFAGISAALRDSGKLVFTVSENVDDPDGYALEPSGRFMHGRNYVDSLLKQNGVNALRVENVELRQELGKPVTGFLFVCEKI